MTIFITKLLHVQKNYVTVCDITLKNNNFTHGNTMTQTSIPYTLYSMTASLFSAKVRAWLRYHKINHIDRGAGQQDFTAEIVPHVGRWILPVLKTPAGDIIQDGTDILDWLDANESHQGSIFPENPILKTIAHAFELFGGEGLLRPAMHYRWNFDEHNLAFLKISFKDVLASISNEQEYEQIFELASGRMRKATQHFGAKADRLADIENAYLEFLSLFDKHLSQFPFILGSRPTIADYALFGPMYAHLGRDPYPLALMQQKAPNVFQWLERMNSPCGYQNHLLTEAVHSTDNTGLFSPEQLPDSLLALMSYISVEYLPEISAHVDHANQFLAANPNIKSGTTGISSKGSQTSIGFCEFDWRGGRMSSSVIIYRFYLLKRLTDHFEGLSTEEKKQAQAIFSQTNLANMLTLKTQRAVIRQNYQEVWE